jgi:aconitate hydratase
MPNSFGSKATLEVDGTSWAIHRLGAVTKAFPGAEKLPYSLKILLENLLRTAGSGSVRKEDILAIAQWDAKADPVAEIAFTPSRVLLQDFTGVPAVVDLAAMRDAMKTMGGNPDRINPLQPVELVIDHSVQVDSYGTGDAFKLNGDLEFVRNRERYVFLRWGQEALENFRVVPPETGIVHQVNLEYLARVVFTDPKKGEAYPDTLVGTDSHTTMVNGLGVLGWGCGGIEAEAAMLGQPVSMLIPQVIGFRLTGKLAAGATATDLVLTVTQILRKKGVVGKFVEFFGEGLSSLSLADRATIANMAPEYGATCGIFPVDEETLRYLRFTGRSETQVKLVEAYMKEQGLFHTPNTPAANYTDTVQLDLGKVEACLAGPSRPQDRVLLGDVKSTFAAALPSLKVKKKPAAPPPGPGDRLLSEGGGGTAVGAEASLHSQVDSPRKLALEAALHGGATAPTPPSEGAGIHTAAAAHGEVHELHDGSVVIAAITSCTNTSNPAVLLAAGLVAKKAVARGLCSKPWVKTSLAPGSKVVTEYLRKAGLDKDLEKLGFFLVGYGCTTCIGNSGPLPPPVSKAIEDGGLVAAAVLSGNRNFEGRVHAEVRANYLASPPLVVAYALAGRVDIDLTKEPLGTDKDGRAVMLSEIWPTPAEVAHAITENVDSKMFQRVYEDVFTGDKQWGMIAVPKGQLFAWEKDSTYVKHPPYFEGMGKTPSAVTDIKGARVLLLLGDSITTDHISPAGSIKEGGPAGQYLAAHGVKKEDWNSYGSRRGNHEVMVRGTFANVRIKNQLAPGTEGGVTRHLPSGEVMSVFDASVKYSAEKVPLVVLAGKEYGSGSSRDWAAKGPKLLGVTAVLAESYERIHRSNLVGMGILPLELPPGKSAAALGLTGEETFDITGLAAARSTGGGSSSAGGTGGGIRLKSVNVTAHKAEGAPITFEAKVRIDTPQEALYYEHGGILPYVLRQLLAAK